MIQAAIQRISPVDEAGGRVGVCLATPAFYPVYGGGALRFHRYLPGLGRRGVEVSVFTGTPNPTRARLSGVDVAWESYPVGTEFPVELLDDVPVHRLRLPEGRPMRRELAFVRGLQRFCRRRSDQPSVVQLLSVSPGSLPWIRALRRLGIAVAHAGTMVTDLPANPVKRELLRRYLRAPLQEMDCIVTSSRVMRDHYWDLGVTTMIEVIPNGVDLTRFHPAQDAAERASLRQKLGVREDEKLLLFVGGVSRRKGVDLLLEAWVQLCAKRADVHLVIAGPRRDQHDSAQQDYHRRLEELIAASGAAERVHFAGLVPNVPQFMRAADVFVFTSHREGMPNVVLEAMATGLPVVTTRFVGFANELGVPGRDFLLVPREARAVAETVEDVLDQPRLAGELASAARGWVERHMDLEQVLDRYAHLYRRLAKASLRRR